MRHPARALAVLFLCAACTDTSRESTGASKDIQRREEAKAEERGRRYGVKPVPPWGLDLQTEYSRLRILELGHRRTLLFVRDDGQVTIHSEVNLASPHTLSVPYMRTMFASYLFHERPERVLIVGLGGGSMVRFLEHYDPSVIVDAIDLDPQMLEIADEYFGTRPSENIHLIAADGFEFIRRTQHEYDVIFMDAFLNPDFESDDSGAPLRMKEAPFYDVVLEKLTPEGVVSFNLTPHSGLSEEIKGIRRAFPQTYLFQPPRDHNLIAIATRGYAVDTAELVRRGKSLDARFESELSFTELSRQLREGGV